MNNKKRFTFYEKKFITEHNLYASIWTPMFAVQTQTIHTLNNLSLVTVVSEGLQDKLYIEQLFRKKSLRTLSFDIISISTYPQGPINKAQTFLNWFYYEE